MNSKWRYFLGGLLFMLYLSLVACSIATSREQAISLSPGLVTLRNGIVHIGVIGGSNKKDPDWLGTGFAIDSKCTFATAKHVLKGVNPDDIVIRFQIPQHREMVETLNARILHKHRKKDLAFIKIDTYRDKPCKTGNLHVFRIYNSPAGDLIGKDILIIGYPKLSKKGYLDCPIVRQGIIASEDVTIYRDGSPMILLDLHGVPGYSGSPVIIKETGEVVGVILGPGPTERIFGFEWATPIGMDDYKEAIANSQD